GVDLVQQGALGGGVQVRVLLVNPLIELRAGLLELSPNRRVALRRETQHRTVQRVQPLLKLAGEVKAVEVRGGQFAFHLPDAMPGVLDSPKHQRGDHRHAADKKREAHSEGRHWWDCSRRQALSPPWLRDVEDLLGACSL